MVFFLMQSENFFQFPFIRLRRFIHTPRLLTHVAFVNRSDRASSKYHEVARPLFFRAQDICAYLGR